MFRKKRKLRYKINYGHTPFSKNSGRKNSAATKLMKRRPSKAFGKVKKYFTLIIILFAIILAIYGIYFSEYFSIKEVFVEEDMENTSAIVTDEITQTIQEAVGENLIFIDTETLEYKILERFAGIEEVFIEKDYPHSLNISFSEFPLTANIVNESPTIKKTFVINSVGYAIKENAENPSLPYIKIRSDEPINTENPIIETGKLKYILETKIYFEDKFGMRIVSMEYKKVARELHLITENDFTIWLDIQQPAEEQLKKLKKALVKLDIYNEPFEYIDLRIAGGNGDKIIYKRR
ncbi:hypothetical protein HN709_04355 [Candidatus Peregrinibacteria bacterium]|jgi:cell division septal protein FtsQ|nr:hypothetical protein [Candidatus Peregrinibacteria bacterium]MBT7736896.1 hypothetical protein [Candidatus Peregrinibacteria bacterium]